MSGTDDGSKFYLDANVVISAVEAPDETGHTIMAILAEGVRRGRRYRDRIARFATSELTLAECLVKPLKENDTELVHVYATLLVDSDMINLEAIDQEVMWCAANLRGLDDKLKLPDAIHLAAAFRYGCTVFLTSDKRLRQQYTSRPLDDYGRPQADYSDRHLTIMNPVEFAGKLSNLDLYFSDE